MSNMDITQSIIVGIIVGIFTLGGVALGYLLNTRQQSMARRIEYTREVLGPLRSFADQMEEICRDTLFILVGMNIGLSKMDKKLIKNSLNKIQRRLVDSPWIPQITDRELENAWAEVSKDFGGLFSTFALLSPTLQKKTASQQVSTSEIQRVLPLIKTGDAAALSSWIAPNPEIQSIYEATKALLNSVRNLREQIKRASTVG